MYHTVVEEWDNCGGAAVAPVTITVGGRLDVGVFTNLHQQPGWTGYAPAAPAIQYLYFLHTLRPAGHLGDDPEYFVALAQRKRQRAWTSADRPSTQISSGTTT